MNERDIEIFLSQNNYDLRDSHNGRWIDQKCTPDVLWAIADYVFNYAEHNNEPFNASDIWNSDYAKSSVKESFSKPDTDNRKAENEYDKFFSQPLCLLCYAGVLKDISNSTRHSYIVNNADILEYISSSPIHAYRFLFRYIEKVLTDSELISVFNDFFDNQNPETYNRVREVFNSFYDVNTNIRGTKEKGRIFSKVMNPLAVSKGKFGTIRGRCSTNVIRMSDIQYNRDNFRDIYTNKPKEMTRKEWRRINNITINTGITTHMMDNAIRRLKSYNIEYNSNLSELTLYNDHDFNDREEGTQAHHIFPKNEFPEIKHYIENLICLTPNQHVHFAHPNNNTTYISYDAQKILLLAKTKSVKDNLQSTDREHIYSFENLKIVLSEGWDDATVLQIDDGDYDDIVNAITCHYQEI